MQSVEVTQSEFLNVIQGLKTSVEVVDQNNTTYASHNLFGEHVGDAIYYHQTKKDVDIPVTRVKYFLNPKYQVKS